MRLALTPATILIVADDPRVRRAMWTTLSSEGCSMVEARSGGRSLVKTPKDRLEHAIGQPVALDPYVLRLTA
jgi:CheY-like chemotaxis protein